MKVLEDIFIVAMLIVLLSICLYLLCNFDAIFETAQRLSGDVYLVDVIELTVTGWWNMITGQENVIQISGVTIRW